MILPGEANFHFIDYISDASLIWSYNLFIGILFVFLITLIIIIGGIITLMLSLISSAYLKGLLEQLVPPVEPDRLEIVLVTFIRIRITCFLFKSIITVNDIIIIFTPTESILLLMKQKYFPVSDTGI